MSKFGSKEEILSAIQSIFENIQSGRLTADEMDSLVELTRELNERAVILRYKSYEEKIFGTAPATFETLFENKPEEKKETIDAVPEIIESQEPSPAEQEEPAGFAEPALGFEQVEAEILQAEPTPVNEEPVFDFDMFEKAEAELFTPEVSSFENTSPPTPGMDIFQSAQEPDAAEEQSAPKVEETQPQSFAPQLEDNIQMSPPQSVFEQAPVADAHPKEENTVIETPQPHVPLPEDLAIMNEPVIEPAQKEEPDMFRKVNRTDDSLSSRLMSSKLETLVGAFGLNEKLQCIRELFKGSSEAFNQAIETLDQQESFAAAKRVLAQHAQQNGWDLDSNLTAEFIQKVERRFL